VLAGSAHGHAQPARASLGARLPFKATLTAATHTPGALRPWRYAVRVTDLKGRPVRAQATFRIVFTGATPPPPRLLGRATFRGSYAGVYRWPRLLRDEPLAFQATITAKGAKRTLRYAVRVR
jgi:hypothetical protein